MNKIKNHLIMTGVIMLFVIGIAFSGIIHGIAEIPKLCRKAYDKIKQFFAKVTHTH